MATLLHDNFTGTAGTAVAGRVPDTTQHGSDVWGDGSGLSIAGTFALISDGASGGAAATAADSAVSYPLTGVAGGQGIYILTHHTVSVVRLDHYLRCNAGSGLTDTVALTLDYSTTQATYTIISGGTTFSSGGPDNVTLPNGQDNVVEVDLGDTAVTFKLNGFLLFGGPITIPSAPTLSKFYWRQESGAVHAMRLISADVASASVVAPTTVTVTGSATLTVGTPATYTYTLNQPAGTGGVSIVPSVTGISATFGTNPIVIASGATSGTTTVNASTAATGTVTGTAAGLAFTAKSVTSSAAVVPTAVAVTGPSALTVGTPGTFTYTLDHPAGTGGVSIVPTSTGFTSTLGTNPIAIAPGATSGTTTVNATGVGAGTKNVTGSASGLTFTPASVTVSATATPPTTLTVTGPASLTEGVAGTYTATLDHAATATVTYTPTASGFAATFAPNPVPFAIGDTAKTFTATTTTAGSGTIGGSTS